MVKILFVSRNINLFFPINFLKSNFRYSGWATANTITWYLLKELNFSGVWTKEYNLQYTIASFKVTLIRGFFKALHIFSSKKNWHKFERRYILYWTDNLYGLNIRPYKEIISNKNDARNSISWLSLNSEKRTLGNHWQEQLPINNKYDE